MLKITNKQGTAVIILVFALSMAMLVIGKSFVIRGLDKLHQIYLFNLSQKANYLALTCAQNALRRLQIDNSYLTENQRIELAGGNCLVTVSADGDDRLVEVKAQISESYQSIIARVTIGDKLELIEWSEN